MSEGKISITLATVYRFFQRRLFIILVGVVLLDVLAPVWWLADLFTHFRVYYLIAAVGLFVLECATRKPWRIVMGGAFLLWIAWPFFPYYLKSQDGKMEGPTQRLLVCNLLGKNQDTERIRQRIATENPDVIVLVEVTHDWMRRLNELVAVYPHRVAEPRPSAWGVWVLSRHPLQDVAVLPILSDDYPSIKATVVLPDGQRVTVVGTHPPPPTGPDLWRFQKERFAALSQIAQTSTDPVIVCGDFNSTPFTPVFRRLVKESGLRDSGLGWGIPRTWHSGIPFIGLAIDHLLVSEQVRVLDRRVCSDIGSDHRPLVIDFQISP